MTYDEAVTIIKEKAPSAIILTKSGNHVALQKAPDSTPFCITVPDSSHLESDPVKASEQEKASLLLSIAAFEKL